MVLSRLIVLLVVIILGSIAAQEVWHALAPIIPLVIILVVVAVLIGGGVGLFRNRW